MTENQLRDEIALLAASIYNRGLTFGSSGNISVRLEDGWLMTPTGATMGELDPARLSKLDANGRHVAGDPSTKETLLHQAMYGQRPDAGAIVHLHSTHSVAVSCLSDIDPANVLPPITAYYVMKVGTLPLVPISHPGILIWLARWRSWRPLIMRFCWPTMALWLQASRYVTRSTQPKNWKRPPSCSCCCAATTRAF